MTVPLHQLLAQALWAQDATAVFGLVGDANLFMIDAFARAGGRYIGCAHEASAVMAAIGYAQVSGAVGIASITHGPALSNAITPLIEAVKGQIPLVVLCGDTPPDALDHLQRCDQRALIAATGAELVELRGPATAAGDLARAFRLARIRRKPVVFQMRVDLQWRDADAAPPAPLPALELPRAAAAGDSFDDAMGMIAFARRPLILAGRGACDAVAQITALAARLQAPMATTLKAAGLFAGHPHDLGYFGTLSEPLTLEVIAAADCIIAFGASLSKLTGIDGRLFAGKRLVQILGDYDDNPRRRDAGLVVIGDPAATALRMIELLDQAEIAPSQHADAALAAALAQARAQATAEAGELPDHLEYEAALRYLAQGFGPEHVLVSDLGRHVSGIWRAFKPQAPRNLVYTAHFGAIGLGLGAAIGAGIAAQDAADGPRAVLLVVGDGGLQLSGISDLHILRRHCPNVSVLICNDGCYGAEHVHFTRRAMDPALSLIAPPPFAALAAVLGYQAIRVDCAADLVPARALLSDPAPAVIELMLDPAAIAAD